MPGIPRIKPYSLPSTGGLPASTARWTPEPGRAVLLIHDMQRYFVEPFPAVIREELIRNIALLRDRSNALGIPVGYTAQPGGMNERERGLLKDFWGSGMRKTPDDRQVVDELAPAPGDWTFEKLRYSAFFRSDLLARMRDRGRDQLILCGVYAHVGLLATAIDAFTNDVETFLVADAVADFSADYHWLALRYAAERCAVVLTAKEVLP